MDGYLTGIFPRSERLIAATRGLDRGRVTEVEVEEALHEELDALVQLQKEAGFGYVTDGLLNWQDLCRPLVEAWEGLTPGGLERWFNNNTFVRQPVVEGNLRARPLAPTYLREIASNGGRRKAILPGPYTFSMFTEGVASREAAILSLGRGLQEVCADLQKRGVAHVQFSEPALVVHPPSSEEWETVRAAYQPITGLPRLEVSLHCFFAPAGSHLDELLELPVDILGLDLYEEDLRVLKDVDIDKVLGCGVVDARNSHLESTEEVVDLVQTIRQVVGPPDLILAPNADLEFLPYEVAQEKVRVLGRALVALREEGG